MARRFLDDWATEWISKIYSNSIQDITGDELQTLIIDLKDSAIQDEAGLTNSLPTPPTITVDLTSAWTRLDDLAEPPVTAYDTVVGGDATFLKVNQANGAITTTSTPGYTYEAIGAITINSANNEVIEATIGIDGVPGDYVASNVGSAGTRPESLFLRRYIPSTPADSEFSIILRAPDGAASNVEITGRSFGLIVQPTRNP